MEFLNLVPDIFLPEEAVETIQGGYSSTTTHSWLFHGQSVCNIVVYHLTQSTLYKMQFVDYKYILSQFYFLFFVKCKQL